MWNSSVITRKKRHYTRLGVYKSLMSPWKGKKEKRKLLQDGVFVICQASKQVLLNFVERKTGRNEVMSLWYYDSTLDHFLLLLLLLSKCIKERKKSLRTPGKIKNKWKWEANHTCFSAVLLYFLLFDCGSYLYAAIHVYLPIPATSAQSIWPLWKGSTFKF